MAINDNHNHFCIYCGAKLDSDQRFCSECGREVFHFEKSVEVVSSKYNDIVDGIEQEYDLKQNKAKELLREIFNSNYREYNKFLSSINESNKLFDIQLDVIRKIIEVDDGSKEFVGREIDNKIKILQTFIDKMNDLIDELIIHLSSDSQNSDDVSGFFEDMDDLINSVKDY